MFSACRSDLFFAAKSSVVPLAVACGLIVSGFTRPEFLVEVEAIAAEED